MINCCFAFWKFTIHSFWKSILIKCRKFIFWIAFFTFFRSKRITFRILLLFWYRRSLVYSLCIVLCWIRSWFNFFRLIITIKVLNLINIIWIRKLLLLLFFKIKFRLINWWIFTICISCCCIEIILIISIVLIICQISRIFWSVILFLVLSLLCCLLNNLLQMILLLLIKNFWLLSFYIFCLFLLKLLLIVLIFININFN